MKIYVMMFTFVAYVVGLSFNAFFVSSHIPNRSLTITNHTTAYSYRYPWLRLRPHSAHECSPLGLLLHCLRHQRLARR
jgi:hypothetical protein